MKSKYQDLYDLINIFASAAINTSAFEYLYNFPDYTKIIDKILPSNQKEALLIIMKNCRLEEDDITCEELTVAEEDFIIKLEAISQKVVNDLIGDNKYEHSFYLDYLFNHNYKGPKYLNNAIFSTMDESLKNDANFAVSIIMRVDNMIKRNDYLKNYKKSPNIYAYPEMLLHFNQDIIKNEKFINLALDHDHAALYAESLYSYPYIYGNSISKFNEKIMSNIEKYSQNRMTTKEEVQSRMFKS